MASNENSWTLEELAEQANKLARESGMETSDGRMRGEISPRTIRHYVSEGALPAPERDGKRAFYGPEHLRKILELRAAQSSGISSKALAKSAETLSATASSLLFSASASGSAPADPTKPAALAFLESLSSPARSASASLSGALSAVPAPLARAAFAPAPAASGRLGAFEPDPGLLSPASFYASEDPLGGLPEAAVGSCAVNSISKSAAPEPAAVPEIWATLEPIPGVRLSAVAGRPAPTDEERAKLLAALTLLCDAPKG